MLRILLALSFLALPYSAYADSFACSFTGENGAKVDVSFSRSVDGVTATLALDGKAVPVTRACMSFAHGNPKMGNGVRCPFGEGEQRLEVYPVFGDKPMVRVIEWNGDEVLGTIESKDCK